MKTLNHCKVNELVEKRLRSIPIGSLIDNHSRGGWVEYYYQQVRMEGDVAMWYGKARTNQSMRRVKWVRVYNG